MNLFNYILIKTKRLIRNVVMLTLTFQIIGCEKFLKIDPPIDETIGQTVFASDETATAAIRGIYSEMIASGNFASGNQLSITMFSGRSADDFINYSSELEYRQFSECNLAPVNITLRSSLWQEPYKMIYACNLVIEELERSTAISSNIKAQLFGEAKFLRAFCHFYLTNLFGEVPLVLSSDYRVSASAFASSSGDIYQQIVKDLSEAKLQLADEYPAVERLRANKWAATALLARVYMYMENWEEAEVNASEIISKTDQYQITDDLNDVFLKNSKEAILQFAVPEGRTNGNTWESSRFILTTAPSATTDVVLSNELLDAFENGDARRTKWVGMYSDGSLSWAYPYKYKNTSPSSITEYSMVLRLAEQYLIRAEARIHLNKIALGISDLNLLRKRARAMPTIDNPDPLPPISESLQQEVALLAVEQERRIELFSEWGHRWLDLKRTKRAEDVLAPLKFPNWEPSDLLYPIPESEVINNTNLVQNPGYH